MMVSQNGRQTIGIALSAAGIVLPPLAFYAPLGTTPLLIIIVIVLLATAGKRCLASMRNLAFLAVLLGTLGVWGLISASWSVVSEHSLTEGFRFLGIALAGLIILAGARAATPDERRWIGRGLVAGLSFALSLLCLERFGGTPIMRFWHPLPPEALDNHILVYYRFDRGMVVLVLMLWAALFAQVPRGLRVVLVVAALAMAELMISTTAWLAVITGIVVFAVARFSPRTVAALMIAGLVALSIAIPLATPSYQRVALLYAEGTGIKWSGIHRLLIWRFASDRVAERPALGWGMDASRAIPGGDTDLLPLLPPENYPPNTQALALPLHPHNAALELLLELGMPGLILGLAIVAWIVVTVAWRMPLTAARRAGALALVASSLIVGLLSFGLWQEWWQSTLWLAAAFFAAMTKPPTTSQPIAVAAPVSPIT